MRWYPRADTGPNPGDVRERSGFLFWPRADEATGQRRWLEFARWTEQYAYWMHFEDGSYYRWQVQEWLP